MERRESVWAWDGGAMGHDTDAYSTSTAASAAPAWAAAAAADAQALPSPTASDVGARLRAAQAADRARARAARMPKAQQVAKHSDQYSASVSATVDLWAATAPGASHEAATQSHAKGVVSARLRAESFKDRGRRPPPGGGRDAGGGNRRGARGKRRRWISGQELLNSTVLSKSLAELATAPTNVPSTPARFESLVQYYGTLQLLVLEEARSIVAQGLESRPLATFTMLRVNNPGDADAASLRELRSLQFNPTRSLDSEQRSTMRPGSVFLLHPQCQSQARGTTAEEYIAIVDGRSGNSDDGSLTFETMPDVHTHKDPCRDFLKQIRAVHPAVNLSVGQLGGRAGRRAGSLERPGPRREPAAHAAHVRPVPAQAEPAVCALAARRERPRAHPLR